MVLAMNKAPLIPSPFARWPKAPPEGDDDMNDTYEDFLDLECMDKVPSTLYSTEQRESAQDFIDLFWDEYTQRVLCRVRHISAPDPGDNCGWTETYQVTAWTRIVKALPALKGQGEVWEEMVLTAQYIRGSYWNSFCWEILVAKPSSMVAQMKKLRAEFVSQAMPR